MQPASGPRCSHCGGQTQWENPPELLPVGAVVQGSHQYQMGALLGSGGFGATYTAMDLTSGQRVAIKEYYPKKCAVRGRNGIVEPKEGMDDIYTDGRYQFLKEAEILARLEGMPAVVQGLEYLEANNTAYLVMEYLDGTPLFRIVNEKGRIPAGDLMPRLRPLLRDIGKLHAKDIIHRDISPDNVMWMKDGSLKLLDFGSARSIEDGKSMTVLLKHGFAPVEQYQTRGQGAWTDVYALAATIYYCLTGVIPQPSPERLQEGDQVKPPTALGAAITPEEEKALMWGLTIRPKERPADMSAFLRALFPEEADTPDSGPKPPDVPKPVINKMDQIDPRKRAWIFAALLAAFAVTAVILIVHLLGSV